MKLILQLFTLTVWLEEVLGHSVVHTSSGRVDGLDFRTTWGTVTVFYGVPYAESPVGEKRFQPSKGILVPRRREVEVAEDSEISNPIVRYESTNVNNGGLVLPRACPQFPQFSKSDENPSLPHGGLAVEEDCLKLNIYVPTNFNGLEEKLPILFFVPGDGFNFADSGEYDGSAMAALGRIIVVTLNYRVGKLLSYYF